MRRNRRGQRERDAAVPSHGFLVFFCLRSTAALGARVGQQVSRQSTDLLVSAVRHDLACRWAWVMNEELKELAGASLTAADG